MTVIVCGGRDYADREHVFSTLDDLEYYGGLTIIEGGARGADALAREWARDNNVTCISVPADWKAHGKAAGPIRNQRMLDEHKPDQVVAFPGGKGTEDMILRAVRAKVCVWFVGEG